VAERPNKELWGSINDKQFASLTPTTLLARFRLADAPVEQPKQGREDMEFQGGDIMSFRASPVCNAAGREEIRRRGQNQRPSIWSIMNSASRFTPMLRSTPWRQDPKEAGRFPSLLKKDAEAYAAKNGGKLLRPYAEVLGAITWAIGESDGKHGNSQDCSVPWSRSTPILSRCCGGESLRSAGACSGNSGAGTGADPHGLF